MKKALWVLRDAIGTPNAVDDLLETTAVRGIFDLVVEVHGPGDDGLDRLIRYGASVGVRIHAWAKDFDAIYADAATAESRGHLIDVFEDVVTRYRVEGFQFDHPRRPRLTGGRDPADRGAITTFVRESAARIRRARPSAVISAALPADPVIARDRALRRWPAWATEGQVDVLCPLVYGQDAAEIARLLAAARATFPGTDLWGGLTADVEAESLREQLRAVWDAGCEGTILFAYDPALRDRLDVLATT